jgi:hypothetical protein
MVAGKEVQGDEVQDDEVPDVGPNPVCFRFFTWKDRARCRANSGSSITPSRNKAPPRCRTLKNWSPSRQPDWLTDEFYVQKIQPKLAEITVRALASAMDVSLPYATAFFPLAAVGTFSFDGKGMASRSYTVSFGGLVFPNHDSGPYTVNSDCTASATFSDATWSMVILGHGREIKAMNASPGVVVQGVLNRQ